MWLVYSQGLELDGYKSYSFPLRLGRGASSYLSLTQGFQIKCTRLQKLSLYLTFLCFFYYFFSISLVLEWNFQKKHLNSLATLNLREKSLCNECRKVSKSQSNSSSSCSYADRNKLHRMVL